MADQAAVANQRSCYVAEDLVHLRRILRHLPEIGDEFAKMVSAKSAQIAHCQAESAKRCPDPSLLPHPALPPDLIDAYDRITRSVRRSIMFYLKVVAPQKAPAADRRIVARKPIIRDVEDALPRTRYRQVADPRDRD